MISGVFKMLLTFPYKVSFIFLLNLFSKEKSSFVIGISHWSSPYQVETADIDLPVYTADTCASKPSLGSLYKNERLAILSACPCNGLVSVVSVLVTPPLA